VRAVGAMDVIVVDDNGTLRSTDWHVQVGNASVPIGSGASVRVFINGAPEDALAMHVGPDGTCHFAASAANGGAQAHGVLAAQTAPADEWCLQPDEGTLRKLKLEMGRNEVRYEVTGQTSLLEATVSLFFWDSEDPVVALHVETAVFKRAALAKGAQALSFGRHSGQSFGWDAPWPYV
jgi:phosphatidate phosphatase PAH1